MTPPIEYKARLGITIERTIVEAIIFASAPGVEKPISYKVNGYTFNIEPVLPMSSPDFAVRAESQVQKLNAEFEAWAAEETAKYLASPQYEADRIARAADVVRSQNVVDSCMAKLNDTIRKGEVPLLHLMAKLAANANDVGVRLDKKRLAKVLNQFGYRAEDAAGLPQEAYRSRRVFARWIVGQVISAANAGLPPHPQTTDIVVQWFSV